MQFRNLVGAFALSLSATAFAAFRPPAVPLVS